MSTRVKLLMTALTAALVLSLGVGTATALRSISLERLPTEVVGQGPITFVGGATQVICNVTFLKTLSRLIPKINGTLIGKITGVRIDIPNCRTTAESVNTIIVLGVEKEELWRIFYESILGTLPRITGALAQLRNVQVLLGIRLLGINATCLYAGRVFVLSEIEAGGIIGKLRTLRETQALQAGSTFGCPRTGEFVATEINQGPGQAIKIILL
jgi:hypothetical protein